MFSQVQRLLCCRDRGLRISVGHFLPWRHRSSAGVAEPVLRLGCPTSHSIRCREFASGRSCYLQALDDLLCVDYLYDHPDCLGRALVARVPWSRREAEELVHCNRHLEQRFILHIQLSVCVKFMPTSERIP